MNKMKNDSNNKFKLLLSLCDTYYTSLGVYRYHYSLRAGMCHGQLVALFNAPVAAMMSPLPGVGKLGEKSKGRVCGVSPTHV